jgi:tetratricopeptide (TPR) repeat protein
VNVRVWISCCLVGALSMALTSPVSAGASDLPGVTVERVAQSAPAKVTAPASEGSSRTPSGQRPQNARQTAKAPVAQPERDAMLTFLMAELAHQKGQTASAVEQMAQLARQHRDASIAARAVELAIRARDLALARRTTALWLELDPESQAASYLADLLHEGTSMTAATEETRKLLLAASDRGPLLAHLNLLFARFPDKMATRLAIEELSRPYKDSPEAIYSRGWAAFFAGDMPAALTAGDQALRQRPGWERAAVLKHTILRKRENDDAASRFAYEHLQAYPDADELRLAHARELAGDRRYKEALAEFVTMVQRKPNDPVIAFSRGLLAQQLDDLDTAVAEYKRALTLNYRDEDAIFSNLAGIAEGRKQFAEARDWLSRIQGLPASKAAKRKMAVLIARTDGFNQARGFLANLPRTSREDKIQHALTDAQILREAKAFELAYGVLDKANEDFPKEPELMYDLAMAAEKVGRLDVLETQLRALIVQKPEFSHAYNALGYTFAERGKNLEEAKTLIEKAISLSPDDPFILDSLGWVHYRMGNLVEALRLLEKAYQSRRDPEIAAHLSEVLWAKGRKDEAMAIVQKGLTEHPEHELLTSVLQKLKP